MPEPIEATTKPGRMRRFNAGDVLMVERKVRPNDGGKPYIWKLFVVVTKHTRWIVHGWVLGGSGYYADNPISFEIGSSNILSVRYLPPEEWPEGVHVLRMAQIMKGRIEDL